MHATMTMKLLAAATLLAVAYANEDLENLIAQRENEVEALATTALNLYQDSVCAVDTTCACDFNACTSSLEDPSCATSFGGCGSGNSDEDDKRKLDFTQSITRLAASDLSQSIREDMCWTQGLDETFTANYGSSEDESSTMRWQYFGAPNGFYRIFPGVPQETCYTYDTRLRPWYVAATSGPKDVVLVLDTSGSMGGTRLSLLKSALDTVLSSLTLNDYVAVVQFGTTASQLCNQVDCGVLSQATSANVESLKGQAQGLFASGGTNFGAGIDLAFDLLESSQIDERTSSCHTAILFLTDGENNGDLEGTALLNEIQQRQQDLEDVGRDRAVFFTYSLGSSAAQDEPKSMACNNDGIWSPIADGSDLRTQMGHFYDYFASLRRQTSEAGVVWVEPYEDASGAGRMTTASKAVYDYSVEPAKLIGVVGVDLLISDIEKVEPNYQQLLTFLAQRSNQCPTLELDVCELQSLRTREYSENVFGPGFDEDARKCSSETTCVDLPPKCTRDGQVYQRPASSMSPYCNTDRSSYESEACSSCSSSSSGSGTDSGVVAGAVIGGLIVFVVVIIVAVLASKQHRSHQLPPATSGPVSGTSNHQQAPPPSTAPHYAPAAAASPPPGMAPPYTGSAYPPPPAYAGPYSAPAYPSAPQGPYPPPQPASGSGAPAPPAYNPLWSDA